MNKSHIRFSIIMSCYNLGELVKDAVNSVLNQSFQNYELILVNDGSQDDTLDVLKKYKAIDNRIRLINNEKNIGLSASRNKAIKIAKGEYIVHLDGDDTFYDNNTLMKVDDTIKDDNPDICYFGVQYLGGSNKTYIPNAKNSTKEARITCDMHFAVSSKVWRRKFLEKTKLEFIEGMYYEDMVYSIKGAILAEKLKFGEFPIYIYRRNRQGSIMSSPNIHRCTDMYKMLYYLMELYEKTPEDLQPYLLSFIENETLDIPNRLQGIIKAMKCKSYTPVFPKRDYKFLPQTNIKADNNIVSICNKEKLKNKKNVSSKKKTKIAEKNVLSNNNSMVDVITDNSIANVT